jgi:hypothetical protein
MAHSVLVKTATMMKTKKFGLMIIDGPLGQIPGTIQIHNDQPTIGTKTFSRIWTKIAILANEAEKYLRGFSTALPSHILQPSSTSITLSGDVMLTYPIYLRTNAISNLIDLVRQDRNKYRGILRNYFLRRNEHLTNAKI